MRVCEDEVGSPKYQVVKIPGDCSNESSENDGHVLCPGGGSMMGLATVTATPVERAELHQVDWTTFATWIESKALWPLHRHYL
jgi:hypothetical protein